MKEYIINKKDFHNIDIMRYWSFPASYSQEKRKETINSMIYGGEYLGSRKMDGALYRFVKADNGEMELIGRSKSVKGDYLNKIDWVPHLQPFFDALPNGTSLIGEIYFPDNEGSNQVTKIMGCLQPKAIERQKDNPIYYYIFDILAYNGKNLIDTIFEERVELLESLKKEYGDKNQFIHWAKYFEGSELYEHLAEILASDGEGVVITRKDSPYLVGKRKARQTLKVKKELAEPLDVVIMGTNPPTKTYGGKYLTDWEYWVDFKTGEKLKGKDLYFDYSNGASIEPVTKAYFNDWIGSLIIGAYKDGQLVPVGNLSGLTEEVLSNSKEYIGRVAEITGMQIMETQGIRHPKLVRFRDDKDAKDCLWSDIFSS